MARVAQVGRAFPPVFAYDRPTMKATDTQRHVISVLVPDRVGILKDVTTAVADMGGNIDGISQTVLEGFFTVILTARLPSALMPAEIERRLREHFRRGEASIMVRPHDAAPRAPDATPRARYVLTLAGEDRPALLKRVTGLLAGQDINIEDWYVIFQGARVTHIGEIAVPLRLDIKQLQGVLNDSLRPLGLACNVQHENIFRSINEVGPIRSLLTEGGVRGS